MSKKTTRKAMLTSVVALVICFAMLVGTTYAWFTDSVSSVGNKIKAGTLDIDLFQFDGTDWVEITDQSAPIFGSDQSAVAQNVNTNTLWEPGKTQVAYLKLVNNGNLWLKYSVAVDVKNVAKDLYEVMKYEIVADAQPDSVTAWDAASGVGVTTGVQATAAVDVPMPPQAEHYFALALHMEEGAGNEYQAGEVDFDLRVLATQYTAERDSFDDQYDALAKYDITSAPMAHTAAGETLSIDSADGSKNVSIDVPGAAAEPGHDLQIVLGNPIATTTAEGTTVDLDISLIDVTTGEKVTANADYTVTISGVGTGLAITSLKHNGEEITSFTYDSVNGTITFVTNSFSPFSYSYVDIPDAVHVKTEAQLKAAVADSSISNIIVDNDIDVVGGVVLVSTSSTIYGNGNTISNTANRVIRLTKADLDVKLYNTKIVSKCTATSDVRGISFDGASGGSSLLLDNCLVSASFYAINAIPGADNLTITVNNGTVAAGWAAFNIYSNNSTITVKDSTLRGLNDKGESSWNNFNTITFDGNCLNRSAANAGTTGSGNTMNIINSVINSSSDTSNNQYWVGIQYGALNNTINVDEATKIVDDNDADMTDNFNIGWYCNYKNGKWDYYDNSSNVIKIGDQELDYYKYTPDAEIA